ncbi:MAG: type II secretion system protein [Candidatus Saccharibacteria bacterium]
MNLQRKEKGFTIIEVVLVLAIAGLIFLMVFLALPALQRNQRDTQRKNDMSRLATALTSYTSSNRGSVPANTTAAWTAFETSYLTVNGDTFIDPSGAGSTQAAATTVYQFVLGTVTTPYSLPFTSEQNIIHRTPNAACGSTADTTQAAGSRSVAFQMVLEGGGVHCVNN